MKYLKKALSLFLCFLMGITGPVISNALADGHGNTEQGSTANEPGDKSAAPCTCPNCPSKSDATNGSSSKRSFFYNGSESLLETDISIPGTFPFSIQRIYNSQSSFDSPLGYGWDISYNMRLRTYKDNSVVIRNPSGVKVEFIFTGGVYLCEENPRLHLTRNSDGSFEFYGQSSGLRHYFDQEGKLVQIKSVFGSSFQMQYSTLPMPLMGMSPNSINPETAQIVSYNYQLQRIDQWDSQGSFTGRFVEFTYDASSGRLVSIEDNTGSRIQYQHDAKGNLIRVTYPEDLYKSYQYTDPYDPHNLTASAYGYGLNEPTILTTREYDESDRMVKESHSGGSLTVDYTIPLQKTTVVKTTTDSTGAVIHQNSTVYEFNTSGYVTRTTDDLKSLELIRDNRNNITERILWENLGSATSPNLTKNLSVLFTFDDDNHMVSSTLEDANGEKIISNFLYTNGSLTEKQTYSSRTPDKIHRIQYEYTYIDGQPTAIKQAKILTNITPVPVYTTVEFEYDSDGRQTAVTYENGDTITLTYENGLLANKDGITFSHDAADRISAVTDRNGNTSQYEYDSAGRTVRIIDPLGGETIYTYTGWNLTRIEQGKTSTAPGIITDFTYDDNGQIISSATDLDGSPIRSQTYSYDSNGNVLSVADQLGRSNTFSYDPWNRLISKTDSNTNTINAVYSFLGTLTSITDAENNTTSYEYDALGRLIQTTDALNGQTKIVRDGLGQIVEISDQEGRVFRFAYDLAGRKISQEMPASGQDAYSYDKRGRVNQIEHQDGTINLYSYNRHNQIEQITLSAGTENSIIMRYGHDSMGNILWYSDSSISQEAVLTMQYDSLNRLISQTLNPINKSLNIEYTGQGQRKKITVLADSSELFSCSYTYDSSGKLSSMTEQPTNKTTSFVYGLDGKLLEKNYANGAKTVLTYSAAGTLSDISHIKSGSAVISHVQYTINKLNKITALSDSLGVTSYSYDGLGQLLGADYPSGSMLADEHYTYDLSGNRLTSDAIVDWQYSDDGKLLSYGSTTLTYDPRGRQQSQTVSGETTAYSYDSLSRLTGVSSSQTEAAFSFDHLNRRIKQTVNNVDSWYLYDGSKVIAEFDNSGQLSRHFSYRPGSYDLLGITENESYYTVLTNHLYAPKYILASDESVLWQADYQAFGEAVIDNDPDNNGIIFSLSNRLPGQHFDETTGFNYNWNRSLDPTTGRYTTPDPSGLTDGLNTYTYGLNDPVNLIDPTGSVAVVTLMIGITTLTMGLIGFLTTYDSKKDNAPEAVFAGSVAAISIPIGILAAPVTIPEAMLLGAGLALTSTVTIQLVNKPDECLTIDQLTQSILVGGILAPLGPLFASGGGQISEELAGWFAGEFINTGLSMNTFDSKEKEIQNQLYWLEHGQTKNGLTAYALIHDVKLLPGEIKQLENDLKAVRQARAAFTKRVEEAIGELQIEAGLLRGIENGGEVMLDSGDSVVDPVY